VPNATVMVIENAERFGLSQLHQLRGRIGRGSEESTCVLLSDAQNDEATERFDIMCKTTDGFVIAKKDLEMRVPVISSALVSTVFPICA
jgi:ATP-dependent DNA helicase RecG